jgi:AAA15 family ATPase/GTPase
MKRPWINPALLEESVNSCGMAIPCGLAILGIRFYTPPDYNFYQQRKTHCMQKSLYGKTDWFLFYDDVKINYIDGSGYEIVIPESLFDPDYFLYRSPKLKTEQRHLGEKSRLQNININAVIGGNGTGKSTLVDMIIRVLNNFSAAVFGENYIYTSAQHLHYIENVYASLAVFIDDRVKVLNVKGNNVSMDTLLREIDYAGKGMLFRLREQYEILKESDHRLPQEILKGDIRFVRLLKEWFYTIVVNYSLYAYNYRDYEFEETCNSKVLELRYKKEEPIQLEDRFWLKGVFHKNDGYQTPIVVNPMREDGYINAQKENYLGKQNLIFLSFVAVEEIDEEGQIHVEFPFREINQTHYVVSFYHQWKESAKYEGFKDVYILGKREHSDDEQKQWNKIEAYYGRVKSFWMKQLGLDCAIRKMLCGKEDTRITQTWDYVVYKTFKIFKNYKVYEDDWDFFMDEGHDRSLEESHLEKLMKDSTHRTRKLRRALAFLKFRDNHYTLASRRVDVDEIYQWMTGHLGESLYMTNKYHSLEVEDLLPPSSCDVALGLIDIENWDLYMQDKVNYKDIIPFGGLSSGERQIAYSISSLIYHLINIDSTVDDRNDAAFETIHYRHANIMMDEVELYFHPDLQRRFVKLLVDALNSMKWLYIESVNVTLITHSPFVLSDIPTRNVLCLSRDVEKAKAFNNTFAANIHDLFNNQFVLPDTIGELARTKIQEFVAVYDLQMEVWKKDEEEWGSRRQDEKIKEQLWNNLPNFDYLTRIIGDEYIGSELRDMFMELVKFYQMEEYLDETD